MEYQWRFGKCLLGIRIRLSTRLAFGLSGVLLEITPLYWAWFNIVIKSPASFLCRKMPHSAHWTFPQFAGNYLRFKTESPSSWKLGHRSIKLNQGKIFVKTFPRNNEEQNICIISTCELLASTSLCQINAYCPDFSRAVTRHPLYANFPWYFLADLSIRRQSSAEPFSGEEIERKRKINS